MPLRTMMRIAALILAVLVLASSARAVDTLDIKSSVGNTVAGEWTTFAIDSALFSTCIAKDGSVWWGIESGAIRFDGQVWTKYTSKDGLMDGAVRAIVQAENGVIWFVGSHREKVAVTRFDGEAWRIYSESEGLGGRWAHAATIDVQGDLWLNTELTNLAWASNDSAKGGYGILRFDGETWRNFRAADGLVHNRVYDLAAAPDGSVWVGTLKGMSRFNGEAWTTEDSLGTAKIYRLLVAQDGAVWCTREVGVSVLNGAKWTHFRERKGMSLGSVRAICQTEDGVIWFGTHQHDGAKGLLRYQDGMWLRILPEDGLSGDNVHTITQSKDGSLWLAVPNVGPVRYRPHFAELDTLSGAVTRPDGSPWNGAGIYVEDKAGRVRAGATAGEGGRYRIRVLPGAYRISAGYDESAGFYDHFSIHQERYLLVLGVFFAGVGAMGLISHFLAGTHGLRFDLDRQYDFLRDTNFMRTFKREGVGVVYLDSISFSCGLIFLLGYLLVLYNVHNVDFMLAHGTVFGANFAVGFCTVAVGGSAGFYRFDQKINTVIIEHYRRWSSKPRPSHYVIFVSLIAIVLTFFLVKWVGFPLMLMGWYSNRIILTAMIVAFGLYLFLVPKDHTNRKRVLIACYLPCAIATLYCLGAPSIGLPVHVWFFHAGLFASATVAVFGRGAFASSRANSMLTRVITSMQQEADNQRRLAELEEARQLQLALLPQVAPNLPHVDISWHMATATEVGGDYYDYILDSDGNLTVILGDATGHGMQAGTVVTASKSLFQCMGNEPQIVETFSAMSRSLRNMNLPHLGMAMMMLKISDRKVRISSAGMPPVLLYRAETGKAEEVLLEGLPLGYASLAEYEEMELEVAKGDTVLLMSDGLPERMNKDDEMLNYERTLEAFESVADQSPDDAIQHLVMVGEEWAGGREQDDDISFVCLKFK